jgi:methylated-DNA-[protein]-cysteine S-methyltransferase
MSHPHPVCREIEPHLPVVAAGEASRAVAERVGRHVGDCAACQQELQRYRAVEGLVGWLKDAPLPGGDPTLARAELEARLGDLRSRLVSFGIFPSPLGPILLARSELGVAMVRYLSSRGRGLGAEVHRVLGEDAVEDRAAIEALHAELIAYLEGRRTRLDWPLDLRLARSDFHRDVLRATAAVPYGAVTSYRGIAADIGHPSAMRAVAQALRHNPLPIVVPCHRIIGAQGDLTGYAGNRLGLKERLLAVEGVRTERAAKAPHVARHTLYHYDPNEQREYCLPTCGTIARRPIGPVTLFASRERAEAFGLVPCTSCRPDLHPLPA